MINFLFSSGLRGVMGVHLNPNPHDIRPVPFAQRNPSLQEVALSKMRRKGYWCPLFPLAEQTRGDDMDWAPLIIIVLYVALDGWLMFRK